jgi:membrane protein YqaA with SNARE-associated domain
MEWLELGYFGLFLATFLAATVVPFSSEAILAAMLYAGFDPIICVIIATVGNTLGGVSSYFLGYMGSWSILHRWFKVDQSKTERWREKINKYGSFMALLCWLPLIGDLIAIALGVFRATMVPVFVFMTLGKASRYVVLIWVFEKMG